LCKDTSKQVKLQVFPELYVTIYAPTLKDGAFRNNNGLSLYLFSFLGFSWLTIPVCLEAADTPLVPTLSVHPSFCNPPLLLDPLDVDIMQHRLSIAIHDETQLTMPLFDNPSRRWQPIKAFSY